MVRALLEGRKTQTRRLLKPQPRRGLYGNGEPIHDLPDQLGDAYHMWESPRGGDIPLTLGCAYRWECQCPYGEPGDRLWVRETFVPNYFDDGRPGFRADWTASAAEVCPEPRWTPAIHMPRRCSRLTLEITRVRVERVQAISEADAKAEGVTLDPIPARINGEPGTAYAMSHRQAFVWLWDAINGKRAPWASNPFVWCISFRRVDEKAQAAE